MSSYEDVDRARNVPAGRLACRYGRGGSDDDAICWHVVYHYRYDPDRRERRNVAVAAFDSFKECDAFMSKLAADLDRRRRQDPAF